MGTKIAGALAATALLAALPTSAHAGSLAGARKCKPAPYTLDLRVKGMKCATGRRLATYWETTGRGHCRKGWTFANVTAGGRTYLSCAHAGARVTWMEGGD